ncbi:MAG: hypothetical protein H7249_15680 [Chitinophagaceae bacterium]|nr:hypothetical protein [Oligoflexus sp.]
MAQYSEDKLRLPLIRKVFRQKDTYICGLCKTNYKTYGDANSCMNQCWFDVHNFYPVVKRKREKAAWVFRCLFCCRDYTSELHAFSCAKRCMGERNVAQLREQLLNEQPLPPPARPVSRLMMLTRVIQPPRPRPVAPRKDQQKELPPASEEVFIPKNEVVRGQHKDSFKKHWARKGEKYQCLYCREIWFTKSESEKCFGDHFDEEDGYEKIASIDPNG